MSASLTRHSLKYRPFHPAFVTHDREQLSPVAQKMISTSMRSWGLASLRSAPALALKHSPAGSQQSVEEVAF